MDYFVEVFSLNKKVFCAEGEYYCSPNIAY